MLKIVLALALLCHSLPILSQTQTDWELVKQASGIQVYTRRILGSEYKEFKAKVAINTSLNDLLTFIKQTQDCSWQYKCLNSLPLSGGYIYKLSELPWPLSNRYTVMKINETQSLKNKTYTLQLTNIPSDLLPKAIQKQLPKLDGTVQMRTSDGYWQFDLNQLPLIYITHQMHGDPAGVIPASLANLGVINAAFVTLHKLKQHFNPE